MVCACVGERERGISRNFFNSDEEKFSVKKFVWKNEKMASDTFKSEIEERGKSDNTDATYATDATQKRV